MAVAIRRARQNDEARLREIAFASKGHWGYDPVRLRDWADGLDLSREIWVAEEEEGAIVAWLALLPPEDGLCELDDLWVDVPAIGRGVGTELFRRACQRARELGAETLRWESEPSAIGFYQRMGAETIGSTRSSWGRTLRVMRVDL